MLNRIMCLNSAVVVVRTGSLAPSLDKLKMLREQRKFKISMGILF
jgi:hypothetical protein